MPHQDDPNDAPFERQREELTPPPSADITTGSQTLQPILGTRSRTVSGRDYKCPRCGGEFSRWDKRIVNGPERSEVCPFCNLQRGQYDPTEEQE